MIPQAFIQELLNRLDIVDVVERHLPLKKAGVNYIACCPFHSEKTPSFTVSQSKQFYHCFGCGAHGTAIGFVMEYNGVGFVEAVKDLAASLGVTVPEERVRGAVHPAEGETDLHQIMMQATRFYRDQLKQSTRAIAYLKRRGLGGETAARFGIGYAPPAWQSLAAVYPDYKAKALTDAGLVIQGEDGKRYDRFRDRIMFPIVNQRGQVVGFGGRVLEQGEPFDSAQGGPKYLNSPETPLFEKGRELYGLFQARKAIREAGKVVVVEGYMDAVALAQHGIGYAVATLGTATTPHHVQRLLRQCDDVVFCFDGDDAGRRAAWRALENSLAQLVDGKRVSFLFLPQDEDPDSYVRKAGREGFERLLKEALALSAYLLRELSGRVDLNTEEGRAKLLQDAKPLVTQIAAPMLSLMLRKRLAELAGIRQEELEQQYQTRSGAKTPRPQRLERGILSNYRTILRCLVSNPELASSCAELNLPEGREPEVKILRELLEILLKSSPQVANTAGILQLFLESPHSTVLDKVEKEILLLGDSYDVKADLSLALEQIRNRDEGQKVAETLASRASPKDLTPEEKERVRYGGRRPTARAEK